MAEGEGNFGMNSVREYYLMHRNDIVTTLSIDESNGYIIRVGESGDYRLLPLGGRMSQEHLKRWWQQRAVPVNQGNIKMQLRENHIPTPQNLLLSNLGLSLTDHYWVNPVDKMYEWSDVNLFTNDFKDEIGEFQFKDSLSDGNLLLNLRNKTVFYPSASLQGELQKKWIIQGGKRYLIKGNYGASYQQSINEVIATLLHQKQERMAYTKYKMCAIDVAGDEGIGCACEDFCSESVEFISAYDISNSEKKKNDKSEYEHFIEVCVRHGLQEEVVRNFLEYQILSDFVMTNTDRHFNNFGVLRDSESLEFLGMAPIFDSGNSMFWNRPSFTNRKSLLDIPVSSFRKREVDLLRYVQNVRILDIDKLPSETEVRQLLMEDIDYKNRGEDVLVGYGKKIELLERFQEGERLWQR